MTKSPPPQAPEPEPMALPGTVKVQHISRNVEAPTSGFAAQSVIADRYVLTEPLAKGGMSVLWRAVDRAGGREVVVKFLRLELGKDLRARFDEEARIAGALRSPHIVELHDVGIADGVPFMVFERLIGEDLADRLTQRRKLTLAETSWVARQTARGLQVAHRAGVVHRDIKPSNLFIARDADAGGERLKILDFGVAKVMMASGGRMTSPGVVIGSPLSMSPEQAAGTGVLDFRADLFALATVLYRCVLGQPPFRGADFVSTLASITSGVYEAPTQADPLLPRALDAFFARGLAVDPERRFKNALELASAFEGAASGAA